MNWYVSKILCVHYCFATHFNLHINLLVTFPQLFLLYPNIYNSLPVCCQGQRKLYEFQWKDILSSPASSSPLNVETSGLLFKRSNFQFQMHDLWIHSLFIHMGFYLQLRISLFHCEKSTRVKSATSLQNTNTMTNFSPYCVKLALIKWTDS